MKKNCSLKQSLNFIICPDSLSSLHSLRNVNSTEKSVVEVQSILYNLEDCTSTFFMLRAIVEISVMRYSRSVGQRGNLPRYEPFDVCAVVPLEAFSLGKNCFRLELRIFGLT
ncbi:RNase H domain-containing protein [Trichonephila clavipes]|nr:RNase H domain-containing protein [Trichonephila clavipes]